MALSQSLSVSDPNSYSEPEKCRVTSMFWDIVISFSDHTIRGSANLTVQKKEPNVDILVLDVRDLTVEEVTLQGTGKKLQFEISNPAAASFGSKLTIHLGGSTQESFTVTIKYVTSPESSALQWLRPEQTGGKRQPYLFSQCQAIHARSLYPCQDTPRVKFPYTAKVQAPKEMTVLMSAERLSTEEVDNDPTQLATNFSMKVPIPSYLLAIVAGDLESRQIGPRSKVWSEKEFVDEAANEFSETEAMLATAEDLVGPYVWGHYDLLVLPPSFPFGGMENPCLTFVTPTLLAGDKSLADVIAHEISHSWTGNLVTNNTFEHFWLNEGHTMFLERKILGRLYGEPYRQEHAQEGWGHLKDTVATLLEKGKDPYTKLVPDLKGVDPDDAFSAVPYEKGFALLYSLETLLGGSEAFESFLRAYIEEFKYQSIDTNDWKNFLFRHFSSQDDQQRLNTVDWDAWFNGIGLPPYTPNYDRNLARPSIDLSSRWISQPDNDLSVFSPSDIDSIPSFLRRTFLSTLRDYEKPLTLAKVEKLQEVYNFNQSRNSEIRLVWLRLCIKARWTQCIPFVLQFVNEQGRMKFVRPLYRDLYQWEEARQQAIDNFIAHRAEMHNTTAWLLAVDLHL